MPEPMRVITAHPSEPDFNEMVQDHSAVCLAANSTVMVPANRDRTSLFVVNDSDVVIYLAFKVPAVIGRGIRINASGGSLEINRSNLLKEALSAIATSGIDKNLTILEARTGYAY